MFSTIGTKKPNANATVGLLLKALRVKISDGSISQSLEGNPAYPSLLAISESLTEWHIPNQAYHISKEDCDPADLEYPFIAHLHPNGGQYVLVKEITEKYVKYGNEITANATMTVAEFLATWSGIALHATTTEKSGEANYLENYLKDIFNNLRLPLLIIVGLSIILLNVDYETINLNYRFSFVIKLAGIGVTMMLLLHSIDVNNPLLQTLCSLVNKSNCNAILKSDAAQVTSWISWSEVGFFYFSGTFLTMISVPSALFFLAWLNMLALPYTFYSISYQYKNKNWCILCCAVQILLFAEFLANISTVDVYVFHFFTFIHLIPRLILAFSVPILTWAAIKPILLKAKLTKPLKQQLNTFKFNSELFQQALKIQPKYHVPSDLMPIVLGNPDAETIITMVSNPFCDPCAKAHQVLEEWLDYRDDLQVNIIFLTANHDDNKQTMLSRHIYALSLIKETKLVERALKDWYGQSIKKYNIWAERYPVSYNDVSNDITTKQKAWCDLTEISSTPTILVNGYKLPEAYGLEDIKYLIN